MAESDYDGPEPVASEADELTHAELLCLFRDAEQNIRFAKLIQWRTTAGTLAIFVLITLLAPQYGREAVLTKILTFLAPVIAVAALWALVIFQSWQGTEREKVRLILANLSSLARDVHDTKSPLGANVERYILLSFMSLTVLIAGFLTLCRLMRWFWG